MALVPRRRERFADLLRLPDEIDRLFRDLWGDLLPAREEWLAPVGVTFPVVDVYESNGELVVKAELPGMKREDIDVSYRDGMLTIQGERKEEKEVKEGNYHRRESAYGAFKRVIQLPYEVKAEDAKATYKDGVLEIRFPKLEEKEKGTKIQIK